MTVKHLLRLSVLAIGLTASRPLRAQHLFVADSARLSFFSSTPVEDIRAQSDEAYSTIDTRTGSVYFKVAMRSFRFPYELMEKHFNERFAESDRFPYAEFSGKLVGFVMPDTAGIFPVSVEGVLTLHGIAKPYHVAGVIEYKDGQLGVNSVFPVRLADHDMRIPKLLIKNIAEVVEVKVSALYQTGKAAGSDSGHPE
jgi:hypothetical protein